MTAAHSTWPLASAANAAKQRLDAGRGSLADQQCLRAWDRKVRRGSSTMAFDSKYGRDQDGDEPDINKPDDAIAALYKWLRAKLEPDDLSTAEGMIEHALKTTDSDTVVGDEPLNTAGRERGSELVANGRIIMDSATIRAIQEIRAAEAEVAPVAGPVTLACDSAADVYKAGLKALGHNVTGLHPNACKTMFRYLRGQGAKTQTMAMDARARRTFEEKFPGALKLKVR